MTGTGIGCVQALGCIAKMMQVTRLNEILKLIDSSDWSVSLQI
jgi:hypothetical protein